MSFLKDRTFWNDALERAVWTFAQTVVSIITIYLPAISISSTGDLKAGVLFLLSTLPWVILAGFGAAVFSVLKTIIKTRSQE